MSEPAIFTQQELLKVDKTCIPSHIAIIPDGNRRWAKKHRFLVQKGHRQGSERIIEIVKAAKEIGVKTLTIYTFSTENWSRPKTEVAYLMRLLGQFLKEQRAPMQKNGIRLCTIGDIKHLSKAVINEIGISKEATAHCRGVDLVLAVNYGSRHEICRAVQNIVQDVMDQKIRKEEITDKLLGQYLDTAPWKDPDLFIRTSGEMRISNFLLWQLSYTEIYVSDILWPDFTARHLLDAIINFQNRERRHGF